MLEGLSEHKNCHKLHRQMLIKQTTGGSEQARSSTRKWPLIYDLSQQDAVSLGLSYIFRYYEGGISTRKAEYVQNFGPSWS